ncbi:MAG: chemotaxis response regulator protein-glutamate methylesterase [Actinomycetota bacterium]
MHRPRVLVVDDSVVVRRLVSKALEAEGEVEVVGVAADGKIALVNIERLHPDVVILDVAMPVMDGLTALAEIRQRWPGLPVIMFSTLTTRGAEVTLDALALGASDYVLKPSGGDAESSMAKIRAELLPKIAALLPAAREARERTAARIPQRPSRATGQVARATGAAQRGDLIAIGVSTGGATALAELIPSLPETLPVPIAIVQHMPPMFTKILAERLDHKSALHVHEAADGDRMKPGAVYIAPGDLHLAIAARDREVLHVYDGPQENSCRPSVDPLFRTVAERYGAHALGIVMTGMGSDGLRGAEHLAQVGGRILVQDEATSVVWGMPGFVARAGLADAVVALGDLRAEILRRVAVGRDLARGAAS